MKSVIQARFDYPNDTQKQLAERLGISQVRVGQILNHPRIKAAFPQKAKDHLQAMLPKAVKKYEKLLDQSVNLEVSRKVADRLLDHSKVLDQETQIRINVIAEMPTDKVVAIVRDGLKIDQKDVFDGEIVGNNE